MRRLLPRVPSIAERAGGFNCVCRGVWPRLGAYHGRGGAVRVRGLQLPSGMTWWGRAFSCDLSTVPGPLLSLRRRQSGPGPRFGVVGTIFGPSRRGCRPAGGAKIHHSASHVDGVQGARSPRLLTGALTAALKQSFD